MDGFRHVLRPSPGRRGLGLVIQVTLGVLLLWLAAVHTPTPLWRAFLVAMGLGALALAWRGWHGSAVALILDETGLWQEDGVPVAPIEDVDSVDRSLFTFRPSNGFLIRLNRSPGRAWVPGMWWRVGRRVGVGGVTRGADTKIMADALSMMVAQRDGL